MNYLQAILIIETSFYFFLGVASPKWSHTFYGTFISFVLKNGQFSLLVAITFSNAL